MALELTTLFDTHGKLQTVVSDNGTELTSNAILKFADDHKFDWYYIAPGQQPRPHPNSIARFRDQAHYDKKKISNRQAFYHKK